jgi:hypothetical protein
VGRNLLLERLEERQLLAVNVGLSGSEILLTGDTSVTSLNVVYNPTGEVFTVTANSGEEFATDGSLPAGVAFTPDGNSATIAPSGVETWNSLGFSLGTDMTAPVGTAITLGGPGAFASNFGTEFIVINSSGGTTGLTIDDSDDATGQTVAVTSSTLAIGAAPVFDYSSATLTGLTFDAAGAGSNTVNITGTPTASNPLTLAMGTGTGNSVDFGPRADAYGNVTLTTGTGGSTGLTIDDSVGNGSWVYGVTASAVSITGGPTVTYSGATLSSLVLDLNNNGGNTINVTGTPTLPPASPLSISAFAGTGDVVNLGDGTHAASQLGSIDIGSGGGKPLDLTIDDAAGAGDGTIGVSSTAVAFGISGPTFDYSGATLDSLTFDASAMGATTVNVSGTPTATNP